MKRITVILLVLALCLCLPLTAQAKTVKHKDKNAWYVGWNRKGQAAKRITKCKFKGNTLYLTGGLWRYKYGSGKTSKLGKNTHVFTLTKKTKYEFEDMAGEGKVVSKSKFQKEMKKYIKQKTKRRHLSFTVKNGTIDFICLTVMDPEL